MNEIIKWITEKLTVNNVILLILGLDTIRSIIAYMGIVKQESHLGRIIYGRYGKTTIKAALKDMGFSDKSAEKASKTLKKAAKDNIDFPWRDSPYRLLYILSKYTIAFQSDISYGLVTRYNTYRSSSKYYINTMEAVHEKEDLHNMACCMINLIKKERINFDFIVVPKGGNPILAQSVASICKVPLIIAKDRNDAARPEEEDEIDKLFKIIFEGLNCVLEKKYSESKNLTGIVLDCNTSGGTQLLNIITDFNNMITKCDMPINPICNCFTLFRLAKGVEQDNSDFVKVSRKGFNCKIKKIFSTKKDNNVTINIDKKFNDKNCSLKRFFDIDEDDKAKLHEIKIADYQDFYAAYESHKLEEALERIKEKSRYYF